MSKFDLDWEEINAEADLQARLSFNPDLGVPFKAWVAEKRRGEVTKAFRGKKRASDIDAETIPDGRFPSPFEEAFAAEVREIIADAIFLLGKAEQRLLLKKFWNDESLSSSEHKRLYLVEQSLRKHLLSQGYKPEDLIWDSSFRFKAKDQEDQTDLFAA